MNQEQRVRALIRGAYDLHIHPAPSPFHRAMDDFQLLRAADRVGMAGILLKSHYESTAARADLVNRYGETQARAYGTLVLNWPVGGLNPYAVKNALKRGARVIFLPTRDAQNSLCFGNMPGDFFDRPGISVLTKEGTLRPEVYAVMDAVKEFGAVLATGHISPGESAVVCREGAARGVRMVLTHPEFYRTQVDVPTQRELAELGVTIEKCWYNIGESQCTAAQMAEHIRIVGARHCFLTTDRGQNDREAPVDGMSRFLLALLEQGVSEEELYTMTHTVPQSMVTPAGSSQSAAGQGGHI